MHPRTIDIIENGEVKVYLTPRSPDPRHLKRCPLQLRPIEGRPLQPRSIERRPIQPRFNEPRPLQLRPIERCP